MAVEVALAAEPAGGSRLKVPAALPPLPPTACEWALAPPVLFLSVAAAVAVPPMPAVPLAWPVEGPPAPPPSPACARLYAWLSPVVVEVLVAVADALPASAPLPQPP